MLAAFACGWIEVVEVLLLMTKSAIGEGMYLGLCDNERMLSGKSEGVRKLL